MGAGEVGTLGDVVADAALTLRALRKAGATGPITATIRTASAEFVAVFPEAAPQLITLDESPEARAEREKRERAALEEWSS